MKRIALSLLSLTLSMTAFAPLAKAETTSTGSLTPFKLTTLAYQGNLTNNGIPGYGSLEDGLRSGSIVAEDVIQAAVDAGRLSETVLDNSEFTTAVDFQLQNLVDRAD